MRICADDIIEPYVILRNLIISDVNSETDKWSNPASTYVVYSFRYEKPLALKHYYYTCFTYKYTTTDKTPSWIQMYHQDAFASGNRFYGLKPSTEYTVSSIVTPDAIEKPSGGGISLTGGAVFHGESNGINGVSGQVKNLIVYDVTELYELLRTRNVATTTDQLKSWCDTNLEHKPRYVNYDISSLVEESTKLYQHEGNLIGNNFVETDGMRIYSVSSTIRDNTYFDTGMPFYIYNNKGNGTVTHTRVDAKEQGSPFYPEHKYVCKIVTNGEANPSAGGFYALHTAKADAVFIEKFVAKVPVGYSLSCAYNSQGTGAKIDFITSNKGTGEWEEYAILYRCGSEGSFSTGGHVYVSGLDNTSVTWYVAYINNCEITGKEELMNYVVLPKKTAIKSGTVFTRSFDTTSIFPNGTCEVRDPSFLPNGWTYDTEDVAGNAKASIVQPVNATRGAISYYIPIDPTIKYKISYWVKCKQDMGSFLTAIFCYDDNGTEYIYGNTMYKPGTKTTLTKELKAGDTTITVKSSENWGPATYSGLGFRSSSYVCYHDLGFFLPNSNLIDSIIDANTIKLTMAYTGPTRPVGTYVCQNGAGSVYPYPIVKSQLPTDNTWKFVSGTFGVDNKVYGGSGFGWENGIPGTVTKVMLALNIYTNTGTVPIKYADIRIEPVTPNSGNRVFDTVQYSPV